MHQARLEVLTEALRHLARKGLMAAAVIANFHRQRVIPLTERNLPIFDLTPEARASGSRTSLVLLPVTSLPGGRGTQCRSSLTTPRIFGR